VLAKCEVPSRGLGQTIALFNPEPSGRTWNAVYQHLPNLHLILDQYAKVDINPGYRINLVRILIFLRIKLISQKRKAQWYTKNQWQENLGIDEAYKAKSPD